MNNHKSTENEQPASKLEDSEANSGLGSNLDWKSKTDKVFETFQNNSHKIRRNFGHRKTRRSQVVDDLPASHRPQNILAALILTVGIAMIAFDIPTYPWIRNLPLEYKWFFGAITDVGNSLWILLSTGLFMLLSMAVDWSKLMFRTRMTLYILWTYSCFIFFVVASSGIIALMLKWSLGRARPKHYEELGAVFFDMFHFSYSYTSFPSGHSTTIAALGTALCLLFPSWFWFIFVIGFWLVVSRIMVSAHYPSDVIAGTLLGITVTLWTARYMAIRRVGFRIVPGMGVRRITSSTSFSYCIRHIFGRLKDSEAGKIESTENSSGSNDGKTKH